MNALKIWIIASWQGMAVGFLIAYVLFKRPQWATSLIEEAKAKLVSLKFW